MTKFIPPGFDKAKILNGLHQAMGFGEPNRTEDKATFFFAKRSDPSPAPVDGAGVPFDPTVQVTNTASPVKKTVACAVEFYDRADVIEEFGVTKPTRIKVTLLDPEWQLVKEFRFVVVGGDKYVRDIEEPVVALGSIDVHQVWCKAEAES